MSDATAPAPTTPATAAPAATTPTPAAPLEGRAAALEKARAALAAKREAANAPAAEATPAPEGDVAPEADPVEAAQQPGPLDKRIRALKAERKRAREATQRAERLIADAEARQKALEERSRSWETSQAEDKALRDRDPYTWATKNGLNFREIAKRAVAEKEKPAELGDLAAHPAIVALQAKLAEYEKQAGTLREQTQAAFTRTHVMSAFSETTAEAYPFLHRAMEPAQVVAEAVRVVDAYRDMHNGQSPDARKVFDALERQYRQQFERLSRAAGSTQQAGGAKAPIPAQAGAASAAQPAGSSKPKVTQRTAGERVSAQAPLSPDERRARAVARLKASAASRH